MEYANFMEAYMDGDKMAVEIGGAMGKAHADLVCQGLLLNTSEVWEGMCRAAWAYHILELQKEGEA